jgi:hypothetical protein
MCKTIILATEILRVYPEMAGPNRVEVDGKNWEHLIGTKTRIKWWGFLL